jgi:hypothetical protein
MTKVIFVIIGILAFWPGLLRSQNLVANGSFEDPHTEWYFTAPPSTLPGWNVSEPSVDVVSAPGYFGFEAADGLQCLDLDGTPGPGQISQSFPVIPGMPYRLSFRYARNYIQQAIASATVRVFGGSGNLFAPDVVTHTDSPAPGLGWVQYSRTFIATGTVATLEFTSLSAPNQTGGILLDVVEVTGPSPHLEVSLLTTEPAVRISWLSITDLAYRVEYSSDLSSGTWLPLVDCVLGDGDVVSISDPFQPDQTQRFYRVVITTCARNPQ